MTEMNQNSSNRTEKEDLSFKSKYKSKNWISFLQEAKDRINTENCKKNIPCKKCPNYKEYVDSIKDSLQNYYINHANDLKDYLEKYHRAISTEFEKATYIQINIKHLSAALSRCKVMILTANPIEKAILHFMMSKGNRRIEQIIGQNNAYYIFKWGEYWVAHICPPHIGAQTDWGSNAAINEALNYFTPNVIISMGVAFGIDHLNQNLGDVIVSQRLLPYNENKLINEKLQPDRRQDKTIDNWLHIRLQNTNGFLENVLYGDVLSGGSVVSSAKVKDKICLGYTESDFIVGGEMEGNALFQYNKREGVPGVVIKGICDWGVMKNDILEDHKKDGEFKDSLQAYAMTQAIERSSVLFNNRTIFSKPKNENIAKLKKYFLWSNLSSCIAFLLCLCQGILLLHLNIDAHLNNHAICQMLLHNVKDVLENPIPWLLVVCIIFFVVLCFFGLIKIIRYSPYQVLRLLHKIFFR